MNIKYDIKKIESIISDFANITGISVALTDLDFNFLALYEYNKPKFCEKLQSSEKGLNLCLCSDDELFAKCRKEKKFVSHTCHAGLTDSMMPIFKKGVIIGYVIFGRTRECDAFNEIYPAISWAGDRESFYKDYMNVSCFNKGQMKSIENLVSKILFENVAEIEFEKPLQKAIDYIDENLDGNLSIAEISKNCYTSKNTLYRLFGETFDCSPNEYILFKRIEKAKELLLSTCKSIAEIGEIVGIYNAPQFCRTFKKIAAISPGEYRKTRK